jgi:superfamily II DNA/RNA helicase
VLTTILKELSFQRCLVFVEKKTLLEQINERLIEATLDPLLIHGSLSQSSRIKIMNEINHSKIIIASDLLARGIDLELDLVILFDARKNDTFWHRIGRTGRFGSLGVAISLDFIDDWKDYEKGEVQEQLDLIEKTFKKNKEWYGTYMTELGSWNETNQEKEVAL